MYADAGRDVVLTSSSIGIVRISGLDDDEYYLLEIEAPAGYNMLKAPVKVSITSVLQHVNFYGSNQDQILTDLYAIVNDDAENPMHCTMLGGGTVTVPLANFSGTTLPETGRNRHDVFLCGRRCPGCRRRNPAGGQEACEKRK